MLWPEVPNWFRRCGRKQRRPLDDDHPRHSAAHFGSPTARRTAASLLARLRTKLLHLAAILDTFHHHLFHLIALGGGR